MTTFEFVFPRWILAEVNTHRMLSKNAASSRAVPGASQTDMILQNPAKPIHWGENEPGMRASKELEGVQREAAIGIWQSAMEAAVSFAKTASNKLGINGHKQWVNRISENYTFTKQVISGTEWANFFWLRDHPDAQPEFRELARCAGLAMERSTPTLLLPGEWHLPYITTDGGKYWLDENTELDLDTARKVSASCCAQVSYRKLDDSIEKAQKIFDMLHLGSTTDPSHSSPTEHQATPICWSVYSTENPPDNGPAIINDPAFPNSWEPGVTHVRRDGSLWSGNLQGWIQYRQLIPHEAKW